MKLIAGSTTPTLAKQIAKNLKIAQIDCDIEKFSNGEKRIWVKDKLRGQNVVVVQSFVEPVDESIIETLLIIDALERMGARHISLVIPWMGYSLQDKVFRKGEPISAKVIADLVSKSYVKRIALMDLHNDSIPAFFDIPTSYLSALDIFAKYIKSHLDLKKSIIVSPDFGGLKRARTFAKKLKLDLANIDKDRDINTGKVKAVDVHGDVRGKIAIVIDDVIVSGGTVVEAASCLKEFGAKKVVFLSSHALFTGRAVEKINQSKIDQIIITNTVEHNSLPENFKVLDVSSVFANNLNKWL
jgi:ribose-phosphate pyrophosphokinase